MKTKKLTGKAWALAAAALLLAGAASCGKEAAEAVEPGGTPVELIFPDAPPAWTSPDGTRTVDLGHGVTEWADGDNIYCYFEFSNSTKNKAVYTYTNGAWKSTDIVIWPEGETLSIFEASYIGDKEPGKYFTGINVLFGNKSSLSQGPVSVGPFTQKTTRLEFRNLPEEKDLYIAGRGFQRYLLYDHYGSFNVLSFGTYSTSAVEAIPRTDASATFYAGLDGGNASTCRFGLFDEGTTPTGQESEGWYNLSLADGGYTDYNSKWLTLDLASLGIVRPGDPSTGFVDAETQRFLDWADAARTNIIGGNPTATTSYTLKGDIDLSLCGYWEPFDLGDYTMLYPPVFDGAGYTIRGLKVDQTITSDAFQAGLFAYNYGTIRNLTVEGTVVGHHSSGSAGNSAGGMAGTNSRSGSIVNCRFRGSVQGKNGAGGIAGANYGLLAGCSYRGLVVKATLENAGGIVGRSGGSNPGIVAGCWSEAESIEGATSFGGIVGYQSSGSYVYGSYYLAATAANGIGRDDNSGNAPSDAGCTAFDPTAGSPTYPDIAVLNAGLDEARKHPTHGAKIPAGMRWVKHPTDPYPFVYNP